MKQDFSASFHVFPIDTGGCGTIKVDPAYRPEIVGTFMKIFVFAVDKDTVPTGELIFFSQIGKSAAARKHYDKQIGGQIRVGADMGLSGMHLSDFL
jgi:hypothetical protein